MADRKYVIGCLKYLHDRETWKEGPLVSDDHAEVRRRITADALALLNGQTAQWMWDRPHHFRCSGCNGVVGQRTYLYCPNCGREMFLSETERMKEWPEEVSRNDR